VVPSSSVCRTNACAVVASTRSEGSLMKTRTTVTVFAACAIALPVLAADMRVAPYAGQQVGRSRLFRMRTWPLAQGRRDWHGEGGRAKRLPWPGSRVASAGQLRLTEDQLRRIKIIYEQMNAAARPLGSDLIARERNSTASLSEAKYAGAPCCGDGGIGELQGRLRLGSFSGSSGDSCSAGRQPGCRVPTAARL